MQANGKRDASDPFLRPWLFLWLALGGCKIEATPPTPPPMVGFTLEVDGELVESVVDSPEARRDSVAPDEMASCIGGETLAAPTSLGTFVLAFGEGELLCSTPPGGPLPPGDSPHGEWVGYGAGTLHARFVSITAAPDDVVIRLADLEDCSGSPLRCHAVARQVTLTVSGAATPSAPSGPGEVWHRCDTERRLCEL